MVVMLRFIPRSYKPYVLAIVLEIYVSPNAARQRIFVALLNIVDSTMTIVISLY